MFERGPENATRLGESRNLKKLNAIVNKKSALEAFENGSPLDDAAMLTGIPMDVFRMAIAKAQRFLQNAREYIYKIKTPSQSDIEMVADIVDQADFIQRSLADLDAPEKKTKK
jgi:hypothetical protein